MLSEEDFYVLNINVPLRAKNRILELSRNIKDGIIQRTASQTKEDANAKAHVSKRPTKPAKVVKGEILQVTVNVFEEKVLRIKQRYGQMLFFCITICRIIWSYNSLFSHIIQNSSNTL